MPASSTKVFDDFIGLIDPEKLVTRNFKRIATLTKDIDILIDKAVRKEYRLPANTKTASLIIGRKPSKPEKTGRFVYSFGITYAFKPIPLSRYVTGYDKGNINSFGHLRTSFSGGTATVRSMPKKQRQGWVHKVQVKPKKAQEISFGRYRLGGWIPRKASGHPVYVHRGNGPQISAKYGYVMFERLGPSRYPVRALLAPSVSMMIARVLDSQPSLSDKISTLALNRLITFK